MPNITITPFDPMWPITFQTEATRLQHALGENCQAIHHIGSTSIPGMAAKPIIDILPVVKDIFQVETSYESIRALGYTVRGENGIPFRRYFSKPGFNVHLFPVGHADIDRHLLFRAWMENHPHDARRYANLKAHLAHQHPTDSKAYSQGKDDFIRHIDAQTGWKGHRLVMAATTHEWQTYHKIRKEQIFDPIGVAYDPHHSSLKDPHHTHLIMQNAPSFVSVAHLEFLNATEAALRSLTTDTDFQRQGNGTVLINFLEKWLVSRNIHSVKLHANLGAEVFFRRLGYQDCVFDNPRVTSKAINLWKTLRKENLLGEFSRPISPKETPSPDTRRDALRHKACW
jgi:GrpB-like predicted nucleotidyltransferase (UPF0157 family)/N-acetylglutamate synthase-like GNAT family acetyltransferase